MAKLESIPRTIPWCRVATVKLFCFSREDCISGGKVQLLFLLGLYLFTPVTCLHQPKLRMLRMPKLIRGIRAGPAKPISIKGFPWLGHLRRVGADLAPRKIEPEIQAFCAGRINRLLDVKPLMGCSTPPSSGEDSTGRTALQVLGQLLKHYPPGLAPWK